MKRRRRLLWALGALVAVAGLTVALWPRPRVVPLAVVDRGLVREVLEEEGTFRAAVRTVVAAPVGGVWQPHPTLVVGGVAEPGAMLGALEAPPPPLLDAAGQAELAATLAAAQATLLEARVLTTAAAEDLFTEPRRQREHRLERDLLDAARPPSAGARQAGHRFDAAVFALRQAEARLLAAHAQHGRRVPVEKTLGASLVVRAPERGEVVQILEPHRRYVLPGAPLVELADLETLEFEVEVPSQLAAQVASGAAVEVVEWGGPALAGRIARVERSATAQLSSLGVEEQRARLRVALDAPAAHLARGGHGYSGRAIIELRQNPRAIRVPEAALVRRGAGWAVFVWEEGRARQRSVALGVRGRELAEVLTGVVPGERVILFPEGDLAEGQRVAPQQEVASPPARP